MVMAEDFCRKVVLYGKSKIVGNSQQILASVLSLSTMYALDPKRFISVCILGESSGGKTAVMKLARGLYPLSDMVIVTQTADRTCVNIAELRDKAIKLLVITEFQKIPEFMVEYLKSMSADDDDYVYRRTNADKTGTDDIDHPKRPYFTTFAQGALSDNELRTRVFAAPIEDNADITGCVIDINLGATEVEYHGETFIPKEDLDLKDEIMDRIYDYRMLEESEDRPKDIQIPFGHALRGVLDKHRSESKRQSMILANLIKSSACLNFEERRMEDGVLYCDAQDVVNVMSMFDLIQASMMGADMLDFAIFKFLLLSDTYQIPAAIIQRMVDIGLPELNQKELQTRLDKLQNENYLVRKQSAGSGGYIYKGNPKKRMVYPTADWGAIWKVDKSSVINPITGDVFKDVRAFGKWLEDVQRPVDIDDAAGPEMDEETFERRSCVIAVINRDEVHKLTTQQSIANAAAAEYAKVKGFAGKGQSDMIMPGIVDAMKSDGVIKFDGDAHKWRVHRV